jgi:hypothetical protein
MLNMNRIIEMPQLALITASGSRSVTIASSEEDYPYWRRVESIHQALGSDPKMPSRLSVQRIGQ